MQFFKDLKEKDFGIEQNFDVLDKYRQFEPIRLKDDYFLSIQASYAHYSRPRQTFSDLNQYTHWELAVFNSDDFVNIVHLVPEFRSKAELDFYFDDSVYSYVPTDLVEEIYLALK